MEGIFVMFVVNPDIGAEIVRIDSPDIKIIDPDAETAEKWDTFLVIVLILLIIAAYARHRDTGQSPVGVG